MPLAIWNVSADSAVVGAVAILAAVVAAVTAQARLRAQVKHDSRLRERDATRDTLDSVPTAITEAVGPMSAAGEIFRELFRVRSATLKTGDDWGLREAEQEAENAVQALRDHRPLLLAASFRLHLRFLDTDPIIARLAEWRGTFDDLADAYQDALDSGDFEIRERFDAAQETALVLGKQLNEFLNEARIWATAGD
jgi:hypothetical protein